MRPAFPWWASVATLAAVGLHFAGGVEAALIYDRAAVLHGEVWRLWTGHLVHFGTSHWLWNLLVFAPAAVWGERIAARETRTFLILAPVAISGLLWVAEAAMERYAGLSGLATGMLALLALAAPRQYPAQRWWWRAVLGIVALKIAMETLSGSSVFVHFTDPTVRNVPLVHVAGVVVAAAVHLLAGRRAKAPR